MTALEEMGMILLHKSIEIGAVCKIVYKDRFGLCGGIVTADGQKKATKRRLLAAPEGPPIAGWSWPPGREDENKTHLIWVGFVLPDGGEDGAKGREFAIVEDGGNEIFCPHG